MSVKKVRTTDGSEHEINARYWGDLQTSDLVLVRGEGIYSGEQQIDPNNQSGVVKNAALGEHSIALGFGTTASGDYSHAEGSSTTASGDYSHAEGAGTTASGNFSHAEGRVTTASGSMSHAEGINTTASGDMSHAEGINTTALGANSHAEGNSTNKAIDYIYNTDESLKTDGEIITAWGTNKFSLAKGVSSHAEGVDGLALGDNSHVEGAQTQALGANSHAEGTQTTAESMHSHSEGAGTTAVGGASHAEGVATRAEGWAAHAEGQSTTASGNQSHAEGYYTETNNDGEHAQGKYNVSTSGSTIHSVGIGTSETDRKNAHEITTTGEHYIYGVGGYNGTNPTEYNDVATYLPNMVEITYSNLKALRDAGNLVPGQQYRITDYVTTTVQANTQSAGHVFDVIVTADDESTLNENARAIQHDGDTYFGNSDLTAWELKYCLDNDTNRFVWADATNGKGVIYYMKDEYNNECPYDFKNIMFIRYELGAPSTSGYSEQWINQLSTNVCEQFNNNQLSYIWGGLDDDVRHWEEVYSECRSYTTGPSKSFYTFSNIINDEVSDKSMTPYCQNNVIKEYHDFVSSYKLKLNNNVFFITDTVINCNSNSFGNDCYSNSFGNNCYYNSFGNICHSNSFGNGCYSNSFGNDCNYNSFGYICHNNSFGNDCNSNSFVHNCYHNSFGNQIDSNTFGYHIYYNSFGNQIDSNTFGNGCYSNSFGNRCFRNSFGNDCYSNSFGNDCYSNSFGNGCYSNSFGNDCNSNSFGYTMYSDSSTIRNNCSKNHFDDGCSSIHLYNSVSTGNIQNVNVNRGVSNVNVNIPANSTEEIYVSRNVTGSNKVMTYTASHFANPIVNQTSATVTIQPNVYNKWGTMYTLRISLASPTHLDVINEYMIEFSTGSTATTLTLPSTIEFVGGRPNIETYRTYQISIINNMAVMVSAPV